MPGEAALERRVREIEDREAIAQLVARYSWVADDRDVEALAELFDEEAQLESHDGTMNSNGREAIVAMLQQRWQGLGPSLHWSADTHVISDPDDPDLAEGHGVLHAEMSRDGTAAIAVSRFSDRYRRGADGRWRFLRRHLSFFYFLDPREYAEVLESTDRVRPQGAAPRAAGFPEALESWSRYYERFPRPAAGEPT